MAGKAHPFLNLAVTMPVYRLAERNRNLRESMSWATPNEHASRAARLRAALRRGRTAIALVVVVATLVAVAGAWLLPARYGAEARILIGAGEASDAASGDQLAAQLRVVASADILMRAARTLTPAGRAALDRPPSLVERGLIMVGLAADRADLSEEARLLDTLRRGLDIRQHQPGVIAVSFRSVDPALAAAVPNAIADQYVALQRDARRQSTPQALAALDAEIASGRAALEEIDARIASFDADVAGREVDPAAEQQLAELSAERARMEASRAALEAHAETLRDAIASGAIAERPELLGSDTVAALLERERALRAEIAEASTTLLDNHPRMRTLRAQLGEVTGQLRAAARRALASLEADVSAAKAREADLSARIDALGAQVSAAKDRLAELDGLERQRAELREKLDTDTVRRREASADTSRFYLPTEARVVSHAGVPTEPVTFEPFTAGIIAFAGSLLAMLALTMLGALRGRDASASVHAALPRVEEMSMPPARPQPEEERWTETGNLPAPVEPDPAPSLDEPASVAPAAPAPVRRTIGEIGVERAAERLIAGGATRAIFVSPEGDEGAAASVLVAREIADAGLRVILLDLTASGAASLPMLEGRMRVGITNLLVAEAQFGDIIHNDLYSTCHVIPVGTADPVRAMRAAERLPIILDSLTTAYDLVIVECGATGWEGIHRLVADDTCVLVSAIEPSEEIAGIAAEIDQHGSARPIIVTPGDTMPPLRPDRTAA